ncbi:MAG TPA: NAD(P)H-dependent oxidoreductase subunit E [Longimicrobiales bacterium]|nr:NAD(P)H-dependent oxidoreductase subunit E [Longimicrobiales bacterium]
MAKRTEAGLPVLRMRPVPKGRTLAPDALREVRELLGEAPRRRDLLIEHLHRIQDARGHLSDDHLLALAREMGLTAAEVYEVATFYHHFDVVKDGAAPPAALTIRVCDSIACEMAGSRAVLESLRERLGDRVRVLAAPCIGRCDSAPAAFVGWRAVDRATVEQVEGVVLEGRTGPELPDYRDGAAYRQAGGYAMLEECLDGRRGVEQVMGAVDASGLKGLGGAGFPASRKWGFVRKEPKPRLMVVNADEGEPGTFKDRFLLETDPHAVLEGMLIAAWAVEASAVYFYLRDEYPACRAILERELESLRSDPPGPLPEIHLRRGAGAYICGEESALIESLEGKRGEPRLRPPFPAQRGVFGRPTLVHNVETLYWLPEILRRGGEWFAGTGREGHPGQRYFSVSGRVARPGVYLAPNGVTVRELIERAGGMPEGHAFYAYLPGGASGGILPASLGDLPLDFGGALGEYGCFVGSGAIVVLSDRDRARDAALNLMRFFAHESCGKCTPCRVGTAKAVELMRDGWDRALLAELGAAMADASICGLGQAAPNPLRTVMEHFPEELDG